MCFPRHTVLLGLLVLQGCAVALETIEPAPTVTWVLPDLGSDGDEEEARLRQEVEQAFQALQASPRSEDRIIWYGRRLAYLGFYEEAIDVYSLGLAMHPYSPKLLRHRGHRYITLRRFPEAVADLERAARLIYARVDEIEPDGIPNAKNRPRSSLHTNVWYHLGLVRYCRGEYERAIYSYEQCIQAARNRDMESAARYWLYLSAMRLGDKQRAKAALAPIRPFWNLVEDRTYLDLILLFRGDLSLEEVQKKDGPASENPTLAYGLACYQMIQGNKARGFAALRTLGAKSLPDFGCVAAEADLALSAAPPR
ncbi:MAG: tetratricopeptide repeat protein [Planctomycetota bacterium]